MAGGTAGADLRNQLNTLAEIGVVGNLSDGALLERIVHDRDGTARVAFTVLVERHGPMVLGLCRQALGNSHDADDAFQATFLVLARKAASVRKVDSVASWLHGVALRVARRARSDVARRREYERRSAEMKATELERAEGPTDSWPELHEEIARLPKHFREPIVLCYLEGLSAEVAAQRLGCARGTILSRLSRARDRLRGRLTHRELGPAPVLMLGGMSPEAPAMPAALLEATVRVSLDYVSHSSTAMTLGATAPAVLAKGVLRAMMISRLRLAAAVMFAGCGIAALTTMFVQNDRALARPPQAPQAQQAKASAEPEHRESIPFQKVALSTDDLVEATGLDVYKFRIDVPKGERFRLALRMQETKEARAKLLHAFLFEKTSEEPAIVCVSFLRMDRKLSGFLMSSEPQAEFRLSCSHCKPGGIATIVPNPLGNLDPTHRSLLFFRTEEENKGYGVDAKETLLLRVMERGAGPGVDDEGYPRGEVVLVRDK
jgi:RNA polymerase sigma factor (sigma-70 family)